METLTVNLNASIRRESLNGRNYLVAPLTMIVQGVLPGSKGSLYYPPEEIARDPSIWNGMPITKGHPYSNDGKRISARSPKVLQEQQIGTVFNSSFSGKLVAEGWFDIEKTSQIAPEVITNLLRRKPMELSTGLYVTMTPVENGSYEGVPFTHVASNFRADHLAVLLDERGACSLQDGCGVLVNSSSIHDLIANYNPSQPRDGQGRWSGGGSSGGGAGGGSSGEKKFTGYDNEDDLVRKMGQTPVDKPRPADTTSFDNAKQSVMNPNVEADNPAKGGTNIFGDRVSKKPEDVAEGGVTGKILRDAKNASPEEKARLRKQQDAEDSLTLDKRANQGEVSITDGMTKQEAADYLAGKNAAKYPKTEYATKSIKEMTEDEIVSSVDAARWSRAYVSQGPGSKAAYEKLSPTLPQTTPGKIVVARDSEMVARTQFEVTGPGTLRNLGNKGSSPESADSVSAWAKKYDLRFEVSDRLIRSEENFTFNANEQGERNMPLSNEKRAEVIQKLVHNCRCNEEDREIFNGMSDESLLALGSLRDDNEQLAIVANAAVTGFATDAGKFQYNPGTKKWEQTPVSAPVENRGNPVQQPKNANDWLNSAPVEIREAVENAMEIQNKEKESLVRQLIVNVADDKKQSIGEKFMKKPIGELRELVSLLPVENAAPVRRAVNIATPNFSESPKVTSHGELTENERSDILEMPSLDLSSPLIDNYYGRKAGKTA